MKKNKIAAKLEKERTDVTPHLKKSYVAPQLSEIGPHETDGKLNYPEERDTTILTFAGPS